MKKKILVVSQYFFPEQFRINDICKEWIDKGYEVTVLTGIPNYPKGDFYKDYGLFKKRQDVYKGINIIRLPIIPRKKNGIFLSLNYLSFMISGYFWAKFTKKKFDKVFIYEVSPMTQAIPGVVYAKKHKISSMIYVMDLWPENFVELSGIKNNQIIKLIIKMVKYIYTNIDKILISSPGFKNKINELGDYEEKIEYWPQYAEDFYTPTKEVSEKVKFDKQKFNITFAGNIGYAQGLEILPFVAQKIQEQTKNVHFNIIGGGRYKDDLINSVTKEKVVSSFTFFDSVEAIEIPKIMNASDCALISMSSSELFSLTIPAKTQSILATGTPIMVSSDGILQQIVEESKAGLWSKAGDVDSLVKNILELSNLSKNELLDLKNNATEYSNKEFSKVKLLNKIDDYWRN